MYRGQDTERGPWAVVGVGVVRIKKYTRFESGGVNTGVGLRGVEKREMGRGRGQPIKYV